MELFERYVESGDLERLIRLYEHSAVLVVEDETRLMGHDAIRVAMRDLLALRPQLELVTLAVHRAGEIALVINQWQLTGAAANGRAVAQSGESSVVVRRQTDGTWRLVIDRP